jgi:hypothetical protein
LVTRGRQVELSASGSTVEVVSMPLYFHAASYNLLDQLFIPLLSSAQQANDLLGLRVGDDKSALRATSYLTGELMRDTSFSPTRVLMTKGSHAYKIDLPGNVFQVETVVFATGASRSSLFRLRVKGAIRGDKFAVVDPETDNTLFSFTRFEADKPEFFVRDFLFLAQESRKDPTMFGGGSSAMDQGVIDLTLGIPVKDQTVLVRVLKKGEASSAEVRHLTSNKVLMSLPLSSLSNLGKLVETIAQHLTANPIDLAP